MQPASDFYKMSKAANMTNFFRETVKHTFDYKNPWLDQTAD